MAQASAGPIANEGASGGVVGGAAGPAIRAAEPVTAASGGRSNAEWVAALGSTSGDAAAERELRARLVSGLRRALGARVDDDLCQDFAQEAMLKVRARLVDFRGESRFLTWALAIAVRLAFDELRHKRWRDVSFDALTAGAASPTTFEPTAQPTQERGLLRAQVEAALREVIDGELTERQKRVLTAELAGMPHAEIALQLGLNRNALYKLAHDARRKVKAGLAARGLSARDVMWAFE